MTDHNDDNDVTVSSRFWLWNYLNDDEKEQNGEENLFCHELSWRISSCLSSPLGPPHIVQVLTKYVFSSKNWGGGEREGCPIESFSLGNSQLERKPDRRVANSLSVRPLSISRMIFVLAPIFVCLLVSIFEPSMLTLAKSMFAIYLWWLTFLRGQHTVRTWNKKHSRNLSGG